MSSLKQGSFFQEFSHILCQHSPLFINVSLCKDKKLDTFLVLCQISPSVFIGVISKEWVEWLPTLVFIPMSPL